jgi:hypothetical protein
MRPLLAFSLLAVLLAPALPALADERPCPQQIEALCPDTEPNSPERRECVHKNAEKLTPECRRRLGHAAPKPAQASVIQGLLDGCKADQPRIRELCKDGSKLLACLNEHKAEFSDGCQKVIGQYSAPRAATK